MEAILDTNFIISCIMKKIDFLEELHELGFLPVLPREVMQELKDLKKGRTSRDERTAIDVAFKIFEKTKIKKTALGQGKVDDWLIKKGSKEGVYIATLDNGIKRAVPNRIVILNAQKKLGAERS